MLSSIPPNDRAKIQKIFYIYKIYRQKFVGNAVDKELQSLPYMVISNNAKIVKIQ